MVPSSSRHLRESGFPYFADGGGIHRFDTVFPLSSCIVHQLYLVESRRSYISCAGRISLSRPLKSIEALFELPVYRLSKIAPVPRYLKTSSPDGMLSISPPSPIDSPPHAFSPRLSRRPLASAPVPVFRSVILGVERIAIARAASLPDSLAVLLSPRLSIVRSDCLPPAPTFRCP